MDKQTVRQILSILKSEYPNAKTVLNYESNYQLLVAVILSAQCTDERVNKVTAVLFKDYPTPEKMLMLTNEELAKIIRPVGLFNSKATHILQATSDIVNKFNGEVPSDFESLISLAGVGRKTADVMLAVAFFDDAIAVDTHVFRVSNRIGLANATTPYKTELQLMKIIDKDKWSFSHHLILWHGRKVCKARSPKCDDCKIKEYCKYYKKVQKNDNR
ncbi:MAG: endonuclease III [Clostridia bacterium]|nr:endonuclease III [Clostridia bacterium]